MRRTRLPLIPEMDKLSRLFGTTFVFDELAEVVTEKTSVSESDTENDTCRVAPSSTMLVLEIEDNEGATANADIAQVKIVRQHSRWVFFIMRLD